MLTRRMVNPWRERFAERGLDRLMDRPRSGCPRTYRNDARLRVVEMACAVTSLGEAHRRVRNVAQATAVGQNTVSASTKKSGSSGGRSLPTHRPLSGFGGHSPLIFILVLRPPRFCPTMTRVITWLPAGSRRDQAGTESLRPSGVVRSQFKGTRPLVSAGTRRGVAGRYHATAGGHVKPSSTSEQLAPGRRSPCALDSTRESRSALGRTQRPSMRCRGGGVPTSSLRAGRPTLS
jgi:hypothetical protein